MDGQTLQRLRQFQDLEKENSQLKMRLRMIERKMRDCLSDIEEWERQKMSNQWALFAFENGKYRCICVMDPDDEEQEDEEMAACAMILPLPDHETLREFDGF